ncbi:hypothetical protein PISMIDRAFT_112672 [Pisolithus microcarpus 441]|uniref:Uncharacterized protein n=1 Tax=Pisolithus microcarpus 441 TaxID=765257 RepID=A0A0C9ZA47_9AGAM|nr:hypothetical protein PISMIDRAFT_112672 [Pisolithus microcarpus 441]
MPRPQRQWNIDEGNQLIAEQRAYDQEELQHFVQAGLPTLNQEQRALYDAVMASVQQPVGSSFWPSPVPPSHPNDPRPSS